MDHTHAELTTQCLCVAQVVINHQDVVHRERIRESLERQMARGIVDKHIQVNRGTYATEYRMQLMVMTPDEFWRVVATEAQRYHKCEPVLMEPK